MLREDYVSLETAELLKEKGFNWEVHRSYLVNDNCFAPADVNDFLHRKDVIRIPTLQMAMKWLREVHGLSIELFVDYGSDDESWWSVDVGKIKKDGLIDTLTGYSSYEQACEAAIKYCLENLF